jgi:hypothetical protein
VLVSRTAAEQFLVAMQLERFHGRNCNINITIYHGNIQCFGKIPVMLIRKVAYQE